MAPVREKVDTVVVGAGVVGLAIARALAHRDHEVVVLESAAQIGSGISSRNSEVIHAGIYYPRNTLKARLCVDGKHALYAYCADYGIPHERCGKLIVAVSEDEKEFLAGMQDRARNNGVDDLRVLTRAEVSAMEPEIECAAALLSPSTGIVDGHALMLSLTGDIENAAGSVIPATAVTGIQPVDGGLIVFTDESLDMELAANLVVIAAGLGSWKMAAHTEGFPGKLIPPKYYCKGSYFVLHGARPFSRLIYPVPEKHGLGIHATLDLNGSVRFGPDTEWVENEDYHVDASRAEVFYRAIRRYYPGVGDDRLSPGYAGIRPKTSGPAGGGQDFQILGPRAHGIPGLVALFGIESPGLTSCLSIAAYTTELLGA